MSLAGEGELVFVGALRRVGLPPTFTFIPRAIHSWVFEPEAYRGRWGLTYFLHIHVYIEARIF